MLSKRLNDFYRRWDIDLGENDKWQMFGDRVINSYSKILGFKIYRCGSDQQEFFEINSIRNTYQLKDASDPSVFRTYCPVYELLLKAKDKQFLQFIQSLFWMKNIDDADKDALFNRFREDIEISQVPLVLEKTAADFLFYQAGAKLLDEKLVNATLSWLEDYPKAYSAFTNALKNLGDDSKFRDVVDNLRLSLELFLRELLGNSKSLENQQNEIGNFLKAKNTSVELSNLYWKLIDYYSKYQNANAKHGSSVQMHEVEFLLYLTGSFIRFLMTLK